MYATMMPLMRHSVKFDIEFKKNPYKGKFIVIEGLDGSGKTTQIPLIQKQLESRGIKVFSTKDPSKGPIGRFIYDVLHGKVKLPATSLQYLYTADRAATQVDIIERLKRGEYVISDRYFWSSVAYGMVDMEKVDDFYLTAYSILSYYNRFLLPDLSVYLDIDPELGMRRVNQTGKPKEHYKKKDTLPKIKEGYEYLLERFPDEFVKIDASKPIEKVTQDIVSLIDKL